MTVLPSLRSTAVRFALMALFLAPLPHTAQASLLEEVTSRGYLRCGVQPTHTGFAAPDTYGVWRGFDVDFCRALAAGILGDAERVMFVSSNRQVGIDSLATGTADVMARNGFGLGALGGEDAKHVGISLHDSYGILRRTGAADSQSASESSICVLTLNGAAQVMRPHLTTTQPDAMLKDFAKVSEALAAYEGGTCAAVAGLRSDLCGVQARLPASSDHALATEEVGKAPAGPRVRGGDERWANAVQWVLFALIEAEELGITMANVEAMREDARSIRVRQLLGTEGELGQMLGLSASWAFDIIKQVGNYGEVYARNLGPDSPTPLPRTRSRLWNDGGMLFAPPVVAR